MPTKPASVQHPDHQQSCNHAGFTPSGCDAGDVASHPTTFPTQAPVQPFASSSAHHQVQQLCEAAVTLGDTFVPHPVPVVNSFGGGSHSSYVFGRPTHATAPPIQTPAFNVLRPTTSTTSSPYQTIHGVVHPSVVETASYVPQELHCAQQHAHAPTWNRRMEPPSLPEATVPATTTPTPDNASVVSQTLSHGSGPHSHVTSLFSSASNTGKQVYAYPASSPMPSLVAAVFESYAPRTK
jgi:hypothetical protein